MHSSRCKSPVCTKTYQICTKTYQICTKTYQICTKTYQISTKTYQICTKTYQICTKTYRICTKISFSSSLLLVFSNVNCVQIGVNFLPDLTQNNCPSIPTDVCVPPAKCYLKNFVLGRKESLTVGQLATENL